MRTLHLPIADPCHEDWEAMDAGERGRFCGKCTKHVHDLSSMTETEARSLLRERAGARICVRYEHDDEGRIRFRTPALARAALAGVALAACTPHDNPRHEIRAADVEAPSETARPITPVAAPIAEMGDVEAVPPPEPERVVKGELAPAPPAEVLSRKGDVAVPNEPCDPPARVEPEPVKVRPRMGKPIFRPDRDF